MRLDDLPIFPALPGIAKALENGSLVLSAETGAGKTSSVPAYLAAHGRLRGRIAVLEPRRIAAVSAAFRVAELLGCAVGELAGYRVRGDSKAGPRTLVEFVTEGVFIRMAQDDPLLSGIGLVAFDEFHERSANGDLALAFAAEAREARGDLSILVMSATLDTEAIAAYLACPVTSVPGRLYPVAVSYRPPSAHESVSDYVAKAALEALGMTDGDVLAFLPGLREIGDTAQAIARLAAGRTAPDVAALHGALSLNEQRSILSPAAGSPRRVILATSVAQTSLTVPRISAVVDSGLSRLVRFHAPSGLDRLVTERVSAAEAEQRSGRAGRLGPGACLRCWHRSDILPPSRGPELDRIDLSTVVLECAYRGALSPDSIRWLDPPPRHAWDEAASVLRSVGLVDDAGAPTETGRRATALGVAPRFAAALLASAADGRAPDALHAVALAAAMLSERMPSGSDGDLRVTLERLARAGAARGDPGATRILAETSRLVSRVCGVHEGQSRFDGPAALAGIENVGDALAPGFPDRLARRLPDGTCEFASGRRAKALQMPPRAEWLVAVDVDAGDPMGRIRQAAPVSAKAAALALSMGAETSLEVEWRALAVAAWERTRFGVFILRERRLDAVPPAELGRAFGVRLRESGLPWLPWDDDSRSLVDRARYAARHGRGDAEPWSDGALLERIAEAAPDWLSPSGPVMDPRRLLALLESLPGRGELERLSAEAPAFVTTPGGRRRRPLFPADGNARLSARIQEFFGMAKGPVACGEPMTLELLSPADRPIQTTSDLAGFWTRTYPSIRAELARRYPRHYWPEDPGIAEATKGQKPRGKA